MSNRDLSEKPHDTSNSDVWWYEEPSGISVIISPKIIDSLRKGAVEVHISWRSIRPALKRKDK